MKRLNGLLDRADEGLRTLLLGRKLPACLLAALTFAAFFALMMTRTLTQLAGASLSARAWGVLVLCLTQVFAYGLELQKDVDELL